MEKCYEPSFFPIFQHASSSSLAPYLWGSGAQSDLLCRCETLVKEEQKVHQSRTREREQYYEAVKERAKETSKSLPFDNFIVYSRQKCTRTLSLGKKGLL